MKSQDLKQTIRNRLLLNFSIAIIIIINITCSTNYNICSCLLNMTSCKLEELD